MQAQRAEGAHEDLDEHLWTCVQPHTNTHAFASTATLNFNTLTTPSKTTAHFPRRAMPRTRLSNVDTPCFSSTHFRTRTNIPLGVFSALAESLGPKTDWEYTCHSTIKNLTAHPSQPKSSASETCATATTSIPCCRSFPGGCGTVSH